MTASATALPNPVTIGIDGEELATVCAAARAFGDDGSGMATRYESDLAEAFAVNEAVAVSSDSATVTVLCGALSLTPGDEVIVSPDVAPWVLGALRQAQITPITDGIHAMSPRTRAIIYVLHASVTAKDLKALRERAQRRAVPLVLDFGPIVGPAARNPAQKTDIALFATGEGMSLSTGEGGVLLFHDSDLAEAARTYAQFGRLDGIRSGVNHKLSPVQAALGRLRLRRLFSMPEPTFGEVESRAAPIPESFMISDRFNPCSRRDESALASALATGLSGSDVIVQSYEAKLANWFQSPHAICVSSGYAAVLVALCALKLTPGDEVLLTPTCPLCTVFALTALGVVPVFCDTEPDSFSINLKDAHRRITSRTRALIEIPMWGYPVPASSVREFTRSHGLAFVLDMALAHGTKLAGELLWRQADIATFSTHASKILVTGEGGFVLTADPELANAVRQVRHYGERPEGVNYRLGGLQAALGLARLPLLAGHILHRQKLMGQIADALRNPHLRPFPIAAGGMPCGVKMLVQETSGNGEALNAHLAVHGIPSDIRTYRCRPLYEFPVLAERHSKCPNATRLLSSIATLPVHPDIGPAELGRIVHALNTYGKDTA